MSTISSKEHGDLIASLDDTTQCHVDVSQHLAGHDDGIVREDGIQQREVAAALGPGQPVSIYPKASSSQDLAQS